LGAKIYAKSCCCGLILNFVHQQPSAAISACESEADADTNTHALFINALSPQPPNHQRNVRVALLRVCEKDEQMREKGINLQLYVGQRGALDRPRQNLKLAALHETGKFRLHTRTYFNLN
jgi:hypothetical protein